MNLTQRQLRMFVSIASTRNLSQAAEMLHISQPALTRALQEFESQLGMLLFERSSRRTTLTREGAEFLPTAQRLLGNLQAAKKVVESIRDGFSGQITVAVGTGIGSLLLPLAISRFHAERPSVSVNLIDDNSRGITSRVLSAEADLGIGTPYGGTESLRCEPLLKARLGYLFNPAIFDISLLADEADVAKLPLLSCPLDTSIMRELTAQGSPLVAKMAKGHEVSTLAMTIAMANAGVGVAVVSAIGAAHPAAQLLKFVPLRSNMSREYYLMSRGEREPRDVVSAFALTVHETIKSELRQGSITTLKRDLIKLM